MILVKVVSHFSGIRYEIMGGFLYLLLEQISVTHVGTGGGRLFNIHGSINDFSHEF